MTRLSAVLPDELLRLAFSAFVAKHPEFELDGLHARPAELERQLDPARPTLVLLDAKVQEANSEFVSRIRRSFPGTEVVFLCDERDGVGNARCGACIKAGAKGCVTTSTPLIQIRDAFKSASAGQPIGTASIPINPLTARELDVLVAVAEGLDNKAIAERLGLREQTVKNHVARIMDKLGATARTQLVRWALTSGHAQPKDD